MGLAFSCKCGALCGSITDHARRRGTHLICHCKDCRAAELFHNRPDPAPNGVALFQTVPDAISISRGRDQLALMRMSPKGVMRWYARCCGTPMFNTLARPQLPFVGILANCIPERDRLGRVQAVGFMPTPGAGAPRHKGAMFMVWRLMIRMIASRLSGRWKETPFFDIETGNPSQPAIVLTKEQRRTLYP